MKQLLRNILIIFIGLIIIDAAFRVNGQALPAEIQEKISATNKYTSFGAPPSEVFYIKLSAYSSSEHYVWIQNINHAEYDSVSVGDWVMVWQEKGLLSGILYKTIVAITDNNNYNYNYKRPKK